MPDAFVFDQVIENPDSNLCDAAAEACREAACDYVVAIGGGSPMDTAKAVAVLLRNPGRCAGFFGASEYANGCAPVVAIPTTAGTGSEVTPYAVIVDTEARVKKTLKGPELFPTFALLDPELSVTMPRDVTANTGLDALSQAMEGVLSRSATALGDALALEACRIVKRWLPAAVRDGQDLEARGQMLYAAMLSGCVIAQAGTTLVHGMGYCFTLECGVAHGLANALLLTPIFQFNAQHEPAKVAALATALGHPAEPTRKDAENAIGRAIHALLEETGVSPAAKDAGVGEGQLAGFAKQIAGEPYRFRNQVGEIDEEQVYAFYRASYEGALA